MNQPASIPATTLRPLRVAFCVYRVSEADLARAEFYRVDLDILRSLGHRVEIVSDPGALHADFDVAFVWWWNYMFLWGPAARLKGLPVVTTGTFDLVEFAKWSFPKQLLKLFGSLFTDRHIFVSEMEAREVPQLLSVPPERVRYSPHVVDTETYRQNSSVKRTAHPFTLLNVTWQNAPNIRRKMVPELLEAFAEFSRERDDARLILAGPPLDGGPILQARAVELGVRDRVSFPGEISIPEKIRLMQECSLYCQVSRFEGFGVAIAEAMSCGAPVLVSRAGAVPEVVGDCGTYVDELSVAGILAGLRRCAADFQACLANAAHGVGRVESRFSVRRRRAEIANVLEELTSGRRRAHG